jgi:hypothetical protein
MAVYKQKVLYLDKDGIHRVKLPKVINTDISWEMMWGAPINKEKQSNAPIRDTVALPKIVLHES